MPLLGATKELLRFLQNNPAIRSRIAAPANATLLYAGNFIRPMWQELEQLKRSSPEVASKQVLPEVLVRIQTPGQVQSNLLAWAKALDSLHPWKDNGFIAWRALSGIFASNARGTVSFAIGSGITKSEKVFAATELPVLLRNPNLDSITRDVLGYYQRCMQNGQSAVNFGFIGG
ncbi:MAG: hypothetical protein ABI607_04345 [Betaproteobacteria bacterium]